MTFIPEALIPYMPFRPSRRDKPATPDEALLQLERFCAFRERSPLEVHTRLKTFGLAEQDADQVYQVLQNEGFFNEARFAEAYALGKFRQNHWGRVRIRQELRHQGIAPDAIEKALHAIDEPAYLITIRQLVDKKKRQWAGDEQAAQKAAASVIRMGYEPELVFPLI